MHNIMASAKYMNIIMTMMSTCVVLSGMRRTSDHSVTGSRPLVAKLRHIRYVLLVNSSNRLNLLSYLLIYLCDK